MCVLFLCTKVIGVGLDLTKIVPFVLADNQTWTKQGNQTKRGPNHEKSKPGTQRHMGGLTGAPTKDWGRQESGKTWEDSRNRDVMRQEVNKHRGHDRHSQETQGWDKNSLTDKKSSV